MRSPFSRWLGLSLLFWGPVWLGACGGNQNPDEEDVVPVDPPALELLGFTNALGQSYGEDAEQIELDCSGLVTIHLGPSTTGRGLLDNWILRPFGHPRCTGLAPCGYLRATFEQNGEEVARSEIPLVDVLVDTSGVTGGSARLTVELIEGKSGEPYLVRKEPVSATWRGRLELPASCEGLGGAPSD